MVGVKLIDPIMVVYLNTVSTLLVAMERINQTLMVLQANIGVDSLVQLSSQSKIIDLYISSFRV